MKTTLFALALTVFLFWISNSSAEQSKQEGEQKVSSSIYITNTEVNGRPTPTTLTEFDCSDKIFAMVTTTGLSNGKHEIDVRWFNPKEEQQERTVFPFFASAAQPSTSVWAWLLLHRARGSGMLQFINPAAGFDDFLGPWKVKIHIDGQFMGEQEFIVSC